MSEDITNKPIYEIISGGLRSVATSFPVAASLGQAWGEYETHKTTQRIQELFNNMQVAIERLNQHVSDLEGRFDNIADEFPSLLEITIDKVRKEFSDEKRELYAHVLIRIASEENISTYDERVTLLHELETLTLIDLNSLKLFRDRERAKVSDLNWQELNLPGNVNEQLEQLASLLPKLESRGLIITTDIHTGIVYPPPGMDAWAARWIATEYKLLPLGKQLLSVLD